MEHSGEEYQLALNRTEQWKFLPARVISFLMIGVGVLAVLFGNPSQLRAAEESRQQLSADFGWKFFKGDQPGADKSNFNDADEELMLFYVSDDDLERASVAYNGGVPTLVGTYCMTCPVAQEIAS